MRTKWMSATVAAAVLFAALLSLSSHGTLAGQKDPYVDKGHKLFLQYCTSCHGNDAKGHGPVASSLRVAPADLTAIQKPGEKFPFDHVTTAIDGEKTDRAIGAHGTGQMPVWGTVFRRTKGIQKEGDVYALAKYIESIQAAK
jgi:mono/diheme cytochrome c family protein